MITYKFRDLPEIAKYFRSKASDLRVDAGRSRLAETKRQMCADATIWEQAADIVGGAMLPPHPSIRFIAVNDDHGWGKGATEEIAILRSMDEGKRATFARVWECETSDAYVDGVGTVYGIKPDSAKEYQRSGMGRSWHLKKEKV